MCGNIPQACGKDECTATTSIITSSSSLNPGRRPNSLCHQAKSVLAAPQSSRGYLVSPTCKNINVNMSVHANSIETKHSQTSPTRDIFSNKYAYCCIARWLHNHAIHSQEHSSVPVLVINNFMRPCHTHILEQTHSLIREVFDESQHKACPSSFEETEYL